MKWKRLIASTTLAFMMSSAIALQPAQAATYQLKDGVLIDAPTKKVVKGYALYKGKLYKDGKLNKGYVYWNNKLYRNSVLNTGYAIVGEGNLMRLYYDTQLKSGTKKARNNTLLFKNGFLAQGNVQTKDLQYLYVDGRLSSADEKVYQKASLYYLYEKGHLSTGEKMNATKQYLFKDGKLDTAAPTQLRDGHLFVEGRAPQGNYLYEGTLYFYGKVSQELTDYKGLYYYKDGKLADGDASPYPVKFNQGVPIVTIDSVSMLDLNRLQVLGEDTSWLLKEQIRVNGKNVKGKGYIQSEEDNSVWLLNTPVALDEDIAIQIGDQSFTLNYDLTQASLALANDTFEPGEENTLALQIGATQKSVKEWKEAGYDIKFTAQQAIFTEGATSTTGELATTNKGVYPLHVSVEKNGKKRELDTKIRFTAYNPKEEVATDEIYLKVRQDYYNYQMTPTKTLVVGELGYVSTVQFANPGFRVNGANLTYTSSDTSVISFRDEDLQDASSEDSLPIIAPHLVAKKAGKAKITVKAGNYTQSFTVNVVDSKRKLTTITAPKTYKAYIEKDINPLAVSGLRATQKDQYGDPYYKATNKSIIQYPKTIPFRYEPIKTFTGTEVYTSLTPTTAGQKGTIYYKNASGKTLAQTVLTTSKLPAKAEIDFNNLNDLTWHYEDVNGKYAGEVPKADVSGYKVRYNPAMLSIDGETTGEYTIGRINYAPVTFLRNGYTTVYIYDKNDKLIRTRTIYSPATRPAITSIDTKDVPTLTAPATIGYKDVLYTLEEAGKDPKVERFTLSQNSNATVRMTQKAREWADAEEYENTVQAGDLYLDYDENGKFSTGDRPVLTVTADNATDYALNKWQINEKDTIYIRYGNVIEKEIKIN